MKYNLLLLFVTLSSVLAKEPPAIVTEKAILSMTVDREVVGKIEIGLFGTIVPKTVKNFAELCKKPSGKGGYKYSLVFKITPYSISAGDIRTGWDGTNGESIYGGPFYRENYKLKHHGAGWVSMISNIDRKVDTKFNIYLHKKAAKFHDGRDVVFGKIIKGMDVVRMIGAIKTDDDYWPLLEVSIKDCTIEVVEKPFIAEKSDATE